MYLYYLHGYCKFAIFALYLKVLLFYEVQSLELLGKYDEAIQSTLRRIKGGRLLRCETWRRTRCLVQSQDWQKVFDTPSRV